MTVASLMVKKDNRLLVAGGYLFLLQTSTTNAIMVTIILCFLLGVCVTVNDHDFAGLFYFFSILNDRECAF